MRILYTGELPLGVTPKDVILGTIGRIGVGGAVGHVLEYAGAADPRALDGRADDDLQHVDRGGRARGDDRARRHDVRLPRGTAGRAEGRRLGARARPLARAAHRRRRGLRPRGRDRRRRARAAGHVGHEPGHGRAGRRHRARPRRRSTTPTSARPPSARSRTWRSSRARRSRTSTSTASSSARARTRGSRTCATAARGRGRASASTRSVRAMVVPGSATVKRQAEDGGPRPRLRARRVRVARRGLLDVPRDEPRHPRAGRALRLDVEPQLRGAAGTRRPHAPRQPGDGGGGGDRGPLRRRPRVGSGASVKAFRSLTARAAVLDRPDVDTDQIIPKQFLKRIERTGYGEFLFYDWRQDPDFELNRPEYDGARSWSPGPNFGCGSSREHAAWALQDYGFDVVDRAVVRRHLLLERGADRARARHPARRRGEGADGDSGGRRRVYVDLETQTIVDPDGPRCRVRDRRVRPHCLLNGLDAIGAHAPARGRDRGVRGRGRPRRSRRLRSRDRRPRRPRAS